MDITFLKAKDKKSINNKDQVGFILNNNKSMTVSVMGKDGEIYSTCDGTEICLSGPTSHISFSKIEYRITNYDFMTPYQVYSDDGYIEQNRDLIVFVPKKIGECFFYINNKQFTVNCWFNMTKPILTTAEKGLFTNTSILKVFSSAFIRNDIVDNIIDTHSVKLVCTIEPIDSTKQTINIINLYDKEINSYIVCQTIIHSNNNKEWKCLYGGFKKLFSINTNLIKYTSIVKFSISLINNKTKEITTSEISKPTIIYPLHSIEIIRNIIILLGGLIFILNTFYHGN